MCHLYCDTPCDIAFAKQSNNLCWSFTCVFIRFQEGCIAYQLPQPFLKFAFVLQGSLEKKVTQKLGQGTVAKYWEGRVILIDVVIKEKLQLIVVLCGYQSSHCKAINLVCPPCPKLAIQIQWMSHVLVLQSRRTSIGLGVLHIYCSPAT